MNIATTRSITLALAVFALTVPTTGQQRQRMMGFTDDWSHHHLVFSNPGTFREAVVNGAVGHWLAATRDPRFVIQQMQHPASPPPAGTERKPRGNSTALHNDWAYNMGTGATVGAGKYPAKYTLDPGSSAPCSDFAVFNTGLAGSTSQATIVAYTNLYTGTCTSPTPTIYWQYNTAYPYLSGGGGTADSSKIVTSVVLSPFGDQVAFVESNASNVASLVILKWASNSSLVQMNTASNNVTTGSYYNCTAPCMTRITFSASHNDTNSSPFYDYTNDLLYVGDDSGVLHKFQYVFKATSTNTPQEITSSWPVTIYASHPLSSPVYDAGTGSGGFVYVGSGWASGCASPCSSLSRVNPSTGAFSSTAKLGGVAIADAPLVDSSAQKVYVFIGNDNSSHCSGSSACSGVYQFSTAGTLSGSGVEAWVGTGSPSATPVTLYAGMFDNKYFSTGTGSLYVCGNTNGNPILYPVPISPTGMTSGAITAGPSLVSSSNSATCSPITEVLNGSNDYIFLSVTANGNIGFTGSNTCTGACVYSFNVSSVLTSTSKALDGIAAAGGASAIIIDNTSSTTGASQVYYSPLSNQTCSGQSGGSGGTGTGGCAVQAAQSVL